VTAVNETLLDEPELINEDPYGEGWLVEVELADEGELEDLLDADAYAEQIE
jgi:glycine cleavage system H protein